MRKERRNSPCGPRATRKASPISHTKGQSTENFLFSAFNGHPSDIELPPGHSMACTRICNRCTRTRSCLYWPSPSPMAPSKITSPSRKSRRSRPRSMGLYTIFEFGKSCTRCPFSGPCPPRARRERFNLQFPSALGWSAWAIEPGMKKISGSTILGGRSWSRPTVGPAQRGRWY